MGDFGKLNFSVSFNRTSAFPIEANGYFESLEAAQAAAATAVEVGSAESTYYIGLTLTVVEGGTSTSYIILPDKSLKEVGNGVGMIDESSDGTGEIFNSSENKATGGYSHAEGSKTQAIGDSSHAEGYRTKAFGDCSHVEGGKVTGAPESRAYGYGNHVEGSSCTIIDSNSSHAEGYGNLVSGYYSHIEGAGVSYSADMHEIISIDSSTKSFVLSGDFTSIDISNRIFGSDKAIIPGAIVIINDKIYTVNNVELVSENTKVTVDEDLTIALEDINYFAIYNKGYCIGNDNHVEGGGNRLIGVISHVEGVINIVKGSQNHVEGRGNSVTGDKNHVEGQAHTVQGQVNHVEGDQCVANGNVCHVEGQKNIVNNNMEHAQGNYNKSNTGDTTDKKTRHSIGIGTSEDDRKNALEVMENGDHYIIGIGGYDGTNPETAKTLLEIINSSSSGSGVGKVDPNSDGTGEIFNAYGSNRASGSYSHAEGQYATASGECSHVEGIYSRADGYSSHAEGHATMATGSSSHAEGDNTKALGKYSHSANEGTVANNYAQTSIGVFNEKDSNPISSNYNATKPALLIGNGSGSTSRGNAFKVLFNGQTFSDGQYSSSGADYAEMFEWKDGNPTDEDRVGRFVTLDGDKIRLATATDTYILGIISGAPTIIGDNPMRWQGKYLNDEWGRPIYEDIEQKWFEKEIQEDGTEIEVEKTRIDHVRKLNPAYNAEEKYIPRSERPEWDYVGMMGKLLVKQDGTLVAGSFCKSIEGGIATKSESGYYVMKVINENQALILFK